MPHPGRVAALPHNRLPAPETCGRRAPSRSAPGPVLSPAPCSIRHRPAPVPFARRQRAMPVFLLVLPCSFFYPFLSREFFIDHPFRHFRFYTLILFDKQGNGNISLVY